MLENVFFVSELECMTWISTCQSKDTTNMCLFGGIFSIIIMIIIISSSRSISYQLDD